MRDQKTMSSRLKVEQTDKTLRVENGLVHYELSRETAGLPSLIRFPGERHAPFSATAPILSARHVTRGVVRPCLRQFSPDVAGFEDGIRVSFHDIPWADACGRPLEGYRLSLQYEMHPDGSVFVITDFFTETLTPGRLREFVLAPVLALAPEEEANWAYWRLPDQITAKLIQDLNRFERNLTQRDERRFDSTILPFVSFDFGTDGRRDRHL
ncbi:MAG: hypothetical protein PHR35_08890, partial [Kiritimatiellae bacterium]|nr:hypothetical protein [Kiritimatiellia bacterium]